MKDMPKTPKLLSIGAFYKSDQEYGFNYSFSNEIEFGLSTKLDRVTFDYLVRKVEELSSVSETVMPSLDAVIQLQQDFIPAFNHIAEPGERMTSNLFSLITLIFGNIALLQKRRVIPCDEYNGMQYTYGSEAFAELLRA